MIFFMWQDDIIGVARCIDAGVEGVYTPAGLTWETRSALSWLENASCSLHSEHTSFVCICLCV